MTRWSAGEGECRTKFSRLCWAERERLFQIDKVRKAWSLFVRAYSGLDRRVRVCGVHVALVCCLAETVTGAECAIMACFFHLDKYMIHVHVNYSDH